MKTSPSADEIRHYYNRFLKTRMIGYRIYGNIRIEAATRFFLENIDSDSTIVEIGCGIGIATEAIAKKTSRGRVIGVDIGDENIWYAKKTISAPNVSFHCFDILNDFEKLKNIAGSPVDIFVLGD